jgi:hypothetical protein
LTICEWFAIKTTRTVFTGLASKPVATVSSGLASKPAATVFSSLSLKPVTSVSPGLASKPVVDFLVEPQNQGGGGFSGLGLKTGSGDLGIKITVMVSWFGHQNHAAIGLSVASQNRRREVDAGHTSRSSSFLGVEANPSRVYQSGLKIYGGATMSDACGTITKVTSEAN